MVIVVEVLGFVVVLGIAVAVTWMAIVGLMGASGVACLKRCRSCRHLHLAWTSANSSKCAYCRHAWLARHVMPMRLRHFFPSEMDPPRAEAGTASDVGCREQRTASWSLTRIDRRAVPAVAPFSDRAQRKAPSDQ